MGKGEEKKITLLRGGKFSFPTELCRLVRTKFSREELRYTLKYTYTCIELLLVVSTTDFFAFQNVFKRVFPFR